MPFFSPRAAPRALPRGLVAAIILSTSSLAVAACSGGESEGGAGSADRGDASAITPTADGGQQLTPDGASPSDAGTDGSTDAASSVRGIVVDVDGTKHELTATARAMLMGNGYGIQANKVDGAKLYGVTIQLVQATGSGGSPGYVTPTPGSYACSATVPTAPYLWARIQYTSPDGTYQYGSGATCVTLTAFGAVGQPVTGTFATTLDRVTNNGPLQVVVSGTFDVDRMN